MVYGAVIVLAWMNTDDWQYLFLTLNLIAIVLMNMFSAIFQGN